MIENRAAKAHFATLFGFHEFHGIRRTNDGTSTAGYADFLGMLIVVEDTFPFIGSSRSDRLELESAHLHFFPTYTLTRSATDADIASQAAASFLLDHGFGIAQLDRLEILGSHLAIR